MAVKWFVLLGLGVMMGVPGCSSAAKPMSDQQIEATGSLAVSYETFGVMAEHSDLVVEVDILSVSHVEMATDSTYYEAEIREVFASDHAAVGDTILVKSISIAEDGEAGGEIQVISVEETLMRADETVYSLPVQP